MKRSIPFLRDKLKSRIEKNIQLWRKNSLKGNLNKNEIKKVGASLLELQRGLTGNRNLAGQNYMDAQKNLGAYLLYYWNITYAQIGFALSDFENWLHDLIQNKEEPVSILDVGSGPGPASCSIVDFLNTDKKIQLTLLDWGKDALELGKKIISGKNVEVKTLQANLEKGLPELEKKSFDIIVSSHCLNELWKKDGDFLEKRFCLVEKLFGLLQDEGILLLCEPAMLESSRNLIALRDRIVESGIGFGISPCCGKGKCPALENGSNQTCHSEIFWDAVEPVKSLARECALDRVSVKMTYFAFEKKSCASENEKKSYTVVSDGMLNKAGRLRFVLCDGEKRITLSAKDKDPVAVQKGFFKLKRNLKISVENPEIRGDKENVSWGVQEATVISFLD